MLPSFMHDLLHTDTPPRVLMALSYAPASGMRQRLTVSSSINPAHACLRVAWEDGTGVNTVSNRCSMGNPALWCSVGGGMSKRKKETPAFGGCCFRRMNMGLGCICGVPFPSRHSFAALPPLYSTSPSVLAKKKVIGCSRLPTQTHTHTHTHTHTRLQDKRAQRGFRVSESSSVGTSNKTEHVRRQ